MKAEQRKELETNTLADKMGQVMQRVKGSPRRTFFTYLIVLAVVAAASWFGWRYYSEYRVTASAQWLQLYDGAGNHIEDLASKDKESNAGKAARFQEAWFLYWDFGVKTLATDQPGSLLRLKKAGELYAQLAEDCKDDSVLEPQALLGRAVVEETRAVQHRDHLEKAKDFYEGVVTKYKDSAEAKFAQQRLDLFKDKDKKRALAETYVALQDLLRVPDRLPPQVMPGGGPGLPGLKGKKDE